MVRKLCPLVLREHRRGHRRGFIGMEIAVALADMWDIKTSVVEFMPQAMPGVMSSSLSDMVRHDLEEHNVDVYTGEKYSALKVKTGLWPAS